MNTRNCKLTKMECNACTYADQYRKFMPRNNDGNLNNHGHLSFIYIHT